MRGPGSEVDLEALEASADVACLCDPGHSWRGMGELRSRNESPWGKWAEEDWPSGRMGQGFDDSHRKP